MIRVPAICRQFTVFCSVGVLNTIVALAIILGSSRFFNLNYMAANALGYLFGVCFGFLLHRNITFKATAGERELNKEFLKFLVFFVVAYITQLIGLVVMVQIISVPEAIAQILAIGIYTVVNFLGNRAITFRANKRDVL